jgi:TonB family protein
MRVSVSRKTKAASPWMLAASIALHGLIILALVVFSATLFKSDKPVKPKVIPAVLVPLPPGPPVAEKLQPSAPEKPQNVPEQQIAKSQVHETVEAPARKTVRSKTMKTASSTKIPVRKRKRKLKRVSKAPKTEPKKKIARKPIDLEEHLAKKLKAIKDRLQKNQRRSSDAQKPKTTHDSRLSGAHGETSDSGRFDEQAARWFKEVRDRVNAHWSIPHENRTLKRETIVGVKIADNGNLLDHGVDQSSGDSMFDTYAVRAVNQANPFPPVPPGIRERIRQEGGLALRFAPGGMK